MNSQVDEFIANAKKWQQELNTLRHIILSCGLVEDLKWKQPCYTINNKNIVLIHGFKNYVAIMFFKGVLIQDADGILIQQSENVQATRQIRFTDNKQILALEKTIKANIYEAIAIEQAGLKVISKTGVEPLVLPTELLEKFKENKKFQTAFEALTPGRQRAYNMHFTAATQSKTRTNRIEAYQNRILSGIGMNDCTCGMSKRMPNCDGSHKYLVKK
jgi:uncharacterized protein YdeI (YjbR/CyaY-like superfamily)